MANPAHLERFAVDSSTLKSVGYDDGVMVVEFVNGSIFSYAVTPDLFAQFCEAPSKGSFYNREIRGKVSGTKLTGKCPACGSEPELIGETCPECGTAEVVAVEKRYE